MCVCVCVEFKLRSPFKVNAREFLRIIMEFPINVILVADLALHAKTQVVRNRRTQVTGDIYFSVL